MKYPKGIDSVEVGEKFEHENTVFIKVSKEDAALDWESYILDNQEYPDVVIQDKSIKH